MGRPIAGRLAQQGFAVSAWNRSPLTDADAEAVAAAGIALVADLAAAAQAAVVALVLSDSAATGAVLAGSSRTCARAPS